MRPEHVQCREPTLPLIRRRDVADADGLTVDVWGRFLRVRGFHSRHVGGAAEVPAIGLRHPGQPSDQGRWSGGLREDLRGDLDLRNPHCWL